MRKHKRLGWSFWIVACLGILGIPDSTLALTFQFDRSQPGIRNFVLSYIQFPVEGKNLAADLPSTFYLITPRTENDTVIAAKTGEIKKNSPLSRSLMNLVGKNPEKIKGPHGETIWYDSKPREKRLSAYTRWGEWLFVAKHREALVTLLKKYSSPQTLVNPGGEFSKDGLKTGSGIRFWGDNVGGDLTALLKENQKKILIPVIQDPSQIRRISGMFRLEGGRKLSGTLIFIPSGPSRDGLRKDLKFANESIRRKLSALKVSHEGEILEGDPGLTFKIVLGDYAKAQPGLVKIQP